MSVIVNVDGFAETLAAACRRKGYPIGTITNRMRRRGVTAAEAFAMGPSKRTHQWVGGPKRRQT